MNARPFRIRSVVQPQGDPKHWKTSVVTIFDAEDRQIGSYDRNYAAFTDETFEPFEIDGRWYALYARDYTCTRVMQLPECIDIGGEEPHAHGFCPAALYVPRYREALATRTSLVMNDSGMLEIVGPTTVGCRIFEAFDHPSSNIVPPAEPFQERQEKSLDVGFVAGCRWGDDASWKLEVFDLSQASEGRLVRSAPFGYVPLVRGMRLNQAVRLHCGSNGEVRVDIAREETRDLRTGNLINPFDE